MSELPSCIDILSRLSCADDCPSCLLAEGSLGAVWAFDTVVSNAVDDHLQSEAFCQGGKYDRDKIDHTAASIELSARITNDPAVAAAALKVLTDAIERTQTT